MRSKSCFATWICVALSSAFMPAHAAEKTLKIYWVDVEGGAATLIVTPAGESLLIDTGNPRRRDPGRIHKLATKRAGLKKIDHLVTTHFHGDHYGGAAELSELMPIGTVYDYGLQDTDRARERADKAYWDLKCDRRVVIKAGDTISLKQVEGGPPLSVTCVAARRKVLAAPDGAKGTAKCAQHKPRARDASANADSVGLVLRFGMFDFLDCGDLTWNIEHNLVCPVNRVGVVDVYQVNHHGLASSNSPLMVKAVSPTVAVMNNGDFKGCSPVAVASLRAAPSIKAVYQLHRHLDPRHAALNTAAEFIANIEVSKDCAGHPVVLTVAPDAKSYTVQVPRTGHKATYSSK
jgi:competence protein ComEC